MQDTKKKGGLLTYTAAAIIIAGGIYAIQNVGIDEKDNRRIVYYSITTPNDAHAFIAKVTKDVAGSTEYLEGASFRWRQANRIDGQTRVERGEVALIGIDAHLIDENSSITCEIKTDGQQPIRRTGRVSVTCDMAVHG